ncbi:MAG: hypothetical protein KJP23_26855 [Deltaproteobacteria bacterium]|nr:hypothetical protein [Deltaproteobacteria bacterium]
MKAASENPLVSVSLDGADAETHEWVRDVAGSFEGALEGIRNLKEAGFRPQIIMSVMRRNQDLLSPFWYCREAQGKGLFPESRLKPKQI